MKKLIILLNIISLIGCASAINQKSATNHMRAAVSARQVGDWDLSRRHWAKAVVNSRLAHEPEQKWQY